MKYVAGLIPESLRVLPEYFKEQKLRKTLPKSLV